MQISISKNDLLDGINTVIKAVDNSNRYVNSLYECLLIDASSNKIRFVANNEEIGIETVVEGKIIKNGKIAIAAHFLQDTIRNIPDGEINIYTDDNLVVTIKSGSIEYNINGKDGDSFNDLAPIKREEKLVINELILKNMITKTIFSISESNANKVLSGESFIIRNGNLCIKGIDGNRVSVRNQKVDDASLDKEIVIPGKSLKEIIKLIGSDPEKSITLYFMPSHLAFEYDETLIVVRLIDGKFINIDNFFIKDYETKATFNRSELVNSLERTLPLIKEDKKPVIIDINKDVFEVKLVTNYGSYYDKLFINTEGINIKIALNPKFLLDALKAIDDDEVSLFCMSQKNPCFIRDENDSYIYIVMPVNINL